MNDEIEPSSSHLGDLRRLHRAQRCPHDLGLLAQPAAAAGRPRLTRTARVVLLAAALVICGALGWRLATALKPQPLVTQREAPAQPEPDSWPPHEPQPHLRTLELPQVEPSEPAPARAERAPERRPVLPGLIAMSSPRAALPSRRRPPAVPDRFAIEPDHTQGTHP